MATITLEGKTVRHVPALQITVLVKPESHYVEYEILCWDGTYQDGTPLFHKAGSPTYPDAVEKIEESEVFAHGSVKWDGCSNWSFDEQERAMLHGCSREDLENLGKMLAYCWDITAEFCKPFAEYHRS